MKELIFLLLSGYSFYFFLFGLMLILKPSKYLFRRRILGVILFILGWYMFISVLVLSGAVLKYPYFFRTGVPFYYLVPPLIYIYVRSIYIGECKFRKYDWLHLIPFVLSFIDLFPYFFLTDNAVKYHDVLQCTISPKAVVVVGEGFLPAVTQYIFRPVQGLIYLFFTWRGIFKSRHQLIAQGKEAKIFTGLFTFLYLGHSFHTKAILSHANWFEFYRLNSFSDFVVLIMIAGTLLVCLFFFSQPSILYESVTNAKIQDEDHLIAAAVVTLAEPSYQQPKLEVKPDLSPEFLQEFLPRLESLMTVEQIFKQQGITINQVALRLDIAPHVLSSVLNKHYMLRFTDFINQYRIEYVIKLIQSDLNYKQFTIEGLSMEAGFASRTPFYTAFKKVTGTTPSEYLGQLA